MILTSIQQEIRDTNGAVIRLDGAIRMQPR
jgi:hypothetical protein